MFPANYFGDRPFAPRYFPKVGLTTVVGPGTVHGGARLLGSVTAGAGLIGSVHGGPTQRTT